MRDDGLVLDTSKDNVVDTLSPSNYNNARKGLKTPKLLDVVCFNFPTTKNCHHCHHCQGLIKSLYNFIYLFIIIKENSETRGDKGDNGDNPY